MLRAVIEFLILIALIIAAAKFLLYQPAKAIATRLQFNERKAGQLLGYLTSAPELVATLAVAATGLMATVAYNILSSNVINVFLAILAALFFRRTKDLLSRRFLREHLLILASIAIPIAVLATGQVESWWLIPVFLVGYLGYLAIIRSISADSPLPTEYGEPPKVERVYRLGLRAFLVLNIAIIALALAVLYFLGTALGDNVYELGTTFGVPEIVLGFVIGIATSLPEATTFVSSYAWHKANSSERASEEVTHNVLASNASNLLLIQTAGLIIFLLIAT